MATRIRSPGILKGWNRLSNPTSDFHVCCSSNILWNSIYNFWVRNWIVGFMQSSDVNKLFLCYFMLHLSVFIHLHDIEKQCMHWAIFCCFHAVGYVASLAVIYFVASYRSWKVAPGDGTSLVAPSIPILRSSQRKRHHTESAELCLWDWPPGEPPVVSQPGETGCCEEDPEGCWQTASAGVSMDRWVGDKTTSWF